MNKLIISISIVFSLYINRVNAHDFCTDNMSNFTNELAQPLHSSKQVNGWGARRSILAINPILIKCSADLNWQRKRIIAAADYWINKKLNYCHHYVPDYVTPPEQRKRTARQGGYCNPVEDIMPGSAYYQQNARWNYSGKGNETLNNWLDHTMWQGLDCSNYTTFLYNFALGTSFSSNVQWQAGQRKQTAYAISPNQQSDTNLLDNSLAAGLLVCADNTLEVNHSCKGHGGYLSVIDQQGHKHKGSVKASDLAALSLYPGDLIFISATKADSPNPSLVTHVVLWTGKQVGYGPNDVPPEKIAPNSTCPQQDWTPHVGDWVITDSHYQGPDYRVLTPCFYLNNLWGIRRVIY